MHIWRSISFAAGAVALSATVAFAAGHIPGQGGEGLEIASDKAGFDVPVADFEKVPELPDAAREGGDNGEDGNEKSEQAVDVPDGFGEMVVEQCVALATESDGSVETAVGECVLNLLGNPGESAGAGDGAGVPADVPAANPDLGDLPEQAPDLGGVPDAGAPEDVPAPDNAGAPEDVPAPDNAGAPEDVPAPDNAGRP